MSLTARDGLGSVRSPRAHRRGLLPPPAESATLYLALRTSLVCIGEWNGVSRDSSGLLDGRALASFCKQRQDLFARNGTSGRKTRRPTCPVVDLFRAGMKR